MFSHCCFHLLGTALAKKECVLGLSANSGFLSALSPARFCREGTNLAPRLGSEHGRAMGKAGLPLKFVSLDTTCFQKEEVNAGADFTSPGWKHSQAFRKFGSCFHFIFFFPPSFPMSCLSRAKEKSMSAEMGFFPCLFKHLQVFSCCQ